MEISILVLLENIIVFFLLMEIFLYFYKEIIFIFCFMLLFFVEVFLIVVKMLCYNCLDFEGFIWVNIFLKRRGG